MNLTAWANGGTYTAGSLRGGIPYIDANGEAQTHSDDYTLVSNQTTWTSGWYLVVSNTTIGSRITVSGDVHLILADGATLSANSGITVEGSNSLIVYALPDPAEVTSDDADAIVEAREALDALTNDQKAYVGEDALKRLTDDEAALAIAEALDEVSAKETSETTYTGDPLQLVNIPTTALPTGYSMNYALTTEPTEPAADLYSTTPPLATDAGTYYVWYKASGPDGDSKVQNVEVTVNAASIAPAEATLDQTSYTYDGKEKTPVVKSVVLDGKPLEEGTDYEVSYKDNVEIGTATAIITGKGNYTGTCEATFQIAAEEVSYELVSSPSEPVKQGTGATVSFEFKRSIDDETTLSHFKSVKVDGKTVPETAYSTRKGSVIITLKSDYIDTLKPGDHELVAVFDDGQGTATWAVSAPDTPSGDTPSGSGSKSSGTSGKGGSSSSSPKMGDSASWLVGLASLATLLSGAAVVIIARKRKEF